MDTMHLLGMLVGAYALTMASELPKLSAAFFKKIWAAIRNFIRPSDKIS